MIRSSLRGLRGRLLLLVLLAFIPAFGLILYSASEQKQHAEIDLKTDVLQDTRIIANAIGQLVEGSRQLLISVATEVMDKEDNPGHLNSYLKNIVGEFPFYMNIVIVDAKGDLKFSALSPASKVNYSDRYWFTQAVKSRAFSVGEYIIARLAHKKAITFSLPVISKGGQIRYVVTTVVDLEWLNLNIAKGPAHRGGSITVVDNKGVILARQPGAEEWVGRSLPAGGIFPSLLALHEGTEELQDVDGVKSIISFTQVPGTNGSIVVACGTPREIALRTIQRTLAFNLAGLAVLTVLVSLIAWFGGYYFVMRHIDALIRVVKRFGNGELSVREETEHNRKDEIGLLSEAFNNMADALQQREAEQKQVEATLKKSEKKLRDITSHLAEGIYVVDVTGRIIFMNAEAERLLGWTMEEMDEKGPHELVHCRQISGRPLPLEECPIHNVVKSGGRYLSTDEVFMRKDGTVMPVSVLTAPIREDGEITAAVTAFRDITEMKNIEKEKEALISDLQEAIARINTLHGILPICSSCKKIRDDNGYWNQLETYISQHTDADFSHSICPACAKKLYPEFYKKMFPEEEG